MKQGSDSFNTDGLLRLIAEGTAHSTGEAFLRELVKALAEALNVRFAFVAEFVDSRTVANVLAWWDGTSFGDSMSYELKGTPCEAVLDGKIKCFPSDVQAMFPHEPSLAALGVQSFLAIPLMSSDNEIMGHLAIMDDKPMQAGPRDIDVFKIFGAQACSELVRKRYDEALTRSEERMTRILNSAMDAIITIDANRHITLFNPAAERIFGCASAWAIGQPFDRFLSRPFRSLLDGYLSEADEPGKGQLQMWAPEGLTEMRANGTEFPIEATLSALEAGGQKLYTIILRDVNERMRTEAELKRLEKQNQFLQAEIKGRYKFEDMVGQTASMKQLFSKLEAVAKADSTVLVIGETGTGKEQVAHAIHNLGARKDKLLVKMNCAALPSELIESELFGHEKGAFTGATAQRKGRFELADGGTLFLDEVGELSLSAQAKLLRVLQEQEFERVGGTRVIRVDVRVIAATNRNLEEMIREGGFRSDLYYRLNVFPVEVPPLRERLEDIPLLANHFLGRMSRKLGRTFHGVASDSMERLVRYGWPGNIRELQNVIERSAVLGNGGLLEVTDRLSATDAVHASSPTASAPIGAQPVDLGTLDDVTAAHIRYVLQQTDWVVEGKRGAAAILGLEPSTLRYRMQKLGIRRPRLGDG
jgi:PAS domain S-box-containing protein